MSKTKELRIVIDKVKEAVQDEMDKNIHWELTEWNYEGELYVKSIVCAELAELYQIRYDEITKVISEENTLQKK